VAPACAGLDYSAWACSQPFVLVEVVRFKRPGVKDWRMVFYREQARGYSLRAVLCHSGLDPLDGHFYTRRRAGDGWQDCDGERVGACRLERGSREAVMLLYGRD
jgi:hypothetical protein